MKMTLRERFFGLLAGLALMLAMLLSACSSMTAQNPPGNLKPVNAVAEADIERLMLKGADVVAYFTQGKYVQGSPQYSSRYQDISFRFDNAEHKALFDVAPQKYLPQYGGYCANGIVYAIPWGGDADTWRIVDGKLYIFGGQGSKDAFELDVPGNIQLADNYWKSEVDGNNSFWQRIKRLVLRVPHYKSGEELARDVRRAYANK